MYVANKWKSATLVLALLMLLTLVSCNHGTDKTPSGTGGNQNTGEQDNRLPIPVEAEDNGWRDFRILMPETNTIDVPKETGSFVSQTLFSVDSKVEEYCIGMKEFPAKLYIPKLPERELTGSAFPILPNTMEIICSLWY